MYMGNWFTDHWKWVAADPVAFITMAIVLAGLGFAAAKAIYSERIEVLKSRLDGRAAGAPASGSVPGAALASIEFSYPTMGRFGRNLLAHLTHEVTVGDHLSMHALVPEDRQLHLVLRGVPPIYVEDTSAAWSFSVMRVTNWVNSLYQQTMEGAEQRFDALAGPADMDIVFHRAGDLVIEAHEGHSPAAVWTKRVRVRAAGGEVTGPRVQG